MRWASWAYFRQLPQVSGNVAPRHGGWAKESWHGPSDKKEDWVEFSQLDVPLPAPQPQSWNDKFIVTRQRGVEDVYDVDHCEDPDDSGPLESQCFTPRVGAVQDIHDWDTQRPYRANIERVGTFYAYYKRTEDRKQDGTLVGGSNVEDIDDRQGLLKSITTTGTGLTGTEVVQKRVEYDYHRDSDNNGNGNGVPDRLISRKTESTGTSNTPTRVTDYKWDTALRQPSEIIVSRDGTPASREFKITYAYTAQGRIDLVTVEDLTSKSLPYAPFSTTGRTRTVDYSYEYHDPNDGKTRLKQIQIDGPRTDVADITTYDFTQSGHLERIEDAEGNVTTWSGHNGRGQPQTRTDPDGTIHIFTYYPRGWIKQYARGSAVWNFQYWPNGLLKSIAIPAGETIEFDYDAARKLKWVKNNFNDEISFSRSFGSGDLNSGVLRVDTTTERNGSTVGTSTQRFDTRGRLFEETGPDGQKTTYNYELGERLAKIVRDGPPEHGTLTTTLAYDGIDRITRVTHDVPQTGGTGVLEEDEFSYNTRNQVTQLIDARNLATDYVIDGFGDLVRVVSPDSGTTDYEYDPAGNLRESTQLLVGGTNVRTTRTYDAASRILTESTSPTNVLESWTYDAPDSGVFQNREGRLSRVVDGSGSTDFGYDAHGNVNRIGKTVNTSIGPRSLTLAYEYSAAGDLTSMTYPTGRVVEYDRSAGRASGVNLRESVGATPSVLADQITYWAFGAGPLRNIRFGNGITLTRERDESGRVDSYRLRDDLGANPPGLILNRSYGYTLLDTLASIADSVAPSDNQTFEYDPRSRLKKAIGPYGTYDFGYDANGNRNLLTLAPGGASSTISEVYSIASNSNRLNSVAITNPNLSVQNYVRPFQYDTRGNVTDDLRSPVEIVKLAYNERNQMKQVGRKVIPEPGSSTMIAVGAGMLAWIARRAKRGASRPGFGSVEWIGGRGFSRARSIFIVLVVLLAGSGLVAAQGAAQDMDSDGIPDAYEDSTIDGNTQTLDLDKTVPNDAQMDFDLDGVINLVEYQNNPAAWEFRDPLACGTLCHPIVNSFSIDKHLLLQTGPGQITVTWSTTHAEQVRIEPFGIVALSGSGTFSIEETTNVVLIATNSNSFRMDAEVVEYYAEQQNNTYDSANQRVLEKTPTLERIYVYGPSGEILSELNVDGSPVVEYVYLEGEPIAQLHGAGSTGRYWVHTSHLGTPEMLTTTTREVAWKVRSRPFGETFDVSPSGTSATQRGRFPGQLFDGATNLHYNWHRYYDPSIGRYISADPIGQRGGMNLYSYVANNPMSLIDPAGLRLEYLTDGAQAAVNEARAYYAGYGIDDPFAALEASGDVFYISTNGSMNNGYLENHISWDPGAALGPLTCSESGGEYQSPAMQLLHEGEHARNDMNGSYEGNKGRPDITGAFGDEEERSVTTGPEATAAGKAGEPGRDDYEAGDYAPVSCVTCRRPYLSEMR